MVADGVNLLELNSLRKLMNIKFNSMLAVFLVTALCFGLQSQKIFAQDTETIDEGQTESEPVVDEVNESEDSDSAGGTVPGRISVELSGTATANTSTLLQVDPRVFDTGLIEVGESITQTVTIRHTGEAGAEAIQINEAALFGATPSEYQVDFNGFQTLFPGDEVQVEVIFTPTSPGAKGAGLRMAIEGLTSPVVMRFEGRSRFPLTSELEVSDTNVAFGQSVVGDASVQTVTLTNTGDPEAPPVFISSFNITGQDAQSFSSNFTQTTILPGETLDVVVTLAAQANGFNQANVSIEHDGNNETIELKVQGTKVAPGSVPVEFTTSKLKGAQINRGTAAQFGPDGKLYVTEINGLIKIYNVTRNGKNNYTATLAGQIVSVQKTQNHNDDGSVTNLGDDRLVTGILVTGTANAPIIYVASSDPRQAAGPSGHDSGLDTNSGILHRLTKNGNTWIKKDLVRGLPRSEENHIPNGIAIKGNKLFLVTGGNTNQGAPSNNFAFLAEYALSSAVLEIDLGAIGNTTYDLPTLDDEDRNGVNDNNDPFGGNNGKNQAKLIPNSPVTVYATGYRNAYDLVIAENGKMYTFDNGPNTGWGGDPIGNCSNQVSNTGTVSPDQLHLINKGSYGGHPNPTRGNKNNTFNASNPQTPIEGPAFNGDCNYKAGGKGDGSLTTIAASSNGMTEYTASNFLGQMKGNLVVASFNKTINRIELNAAGNEVTGKQTLLNGFGTAPLDITAQGDNDKFPGTMWIVDNLDGQITVMEPDDY